MGGVCTWLHLQQAIRSFLLFSINIFINRCIRRQNKRPARFHDYWSTFSIIVLISRVISVRNDSSKAVAVFSRINNNRRKASISQKCSGKSFSTYRHYSSWWRILFVPYHTLNKNPSCVFVRYGRPPLRFRQTHSASFRNTHRESIPRSRSAIKLLGVSLNRDHYRSHFYLNASTVKLLLDVCS